MEALSKYGYGEYVEGYVPEFPHEDEDVEFPEFVPNVPEEEVEEEVVEESEEEVVVVSEESEEEVVVVDSVSTVVVVEEESEEEVVEESEEEVVSESEESYYYPSTVSPVTVYEPSVPTVVVPSEPTVVVEEPTVYEPTVYVPSVSTVTPYVPEPEPESVSTVSSVSSVSSVSRKSRRSRSHRSHHQTYYDDVKPYRPQQTSSRPPVQQVNASGLPDGVSVNVNGDGVYDDSSSCSSDADIVINIFNGMGAPRVGRQLEYKCRPGNHECRPQCPEARYNSADQTVTIDWVGDAQGCEHYAKPEQTVITLFAPSN